jgi:hypothetical protein
VAFILIVGTARSYSALLSPAGNKALREQAGRTTRRAATDRPVQRARRLTRDSVGVGATVVPVHDSDLTLVAR